MTKTCSRDVVELRRPLDVWAKIVQDDLGRAIDGLISAGQHLLDAKREHPGEFGAWLEAGHAGVSRRSAYHLMSIAEQIRMHRGAHEDRLPKAVSTLAELFHLPPAELTEAIDDGRVHPDMTKRDAIALRESSPTPKRHNYPPEVRAEAVERVSRGETAHAVAQAMGVGQSTVSDWIRKARAKNDRLRMTDAKQLKVISQMAIALEGLVSSRSFVDTSTLRIDDATGEAVESITQSLCTLTKFVKELTHARVISTTIDDDTPES